MSGTTIDTVAEFPLGRANLGQECDRIERAILITQPFLHGRGHLGMGQRTLTGRRRSMIALDHFRPFAALLLELERRLEEVDVEPCRRIEAAHHACRFEAVEAAVAHKTAHDGTVLLLDERLIVLLIGTRAGHLEFLLAAPWYDDIVHERAIVVEIYAAQKPGKQALRAFHRLDNQRTIARHQWQTFCPARSYIDHRQRLDE